MASPLKCFNETILKMTFHLLFANSFLKIIVIKIVMRGFTVEDLGRCYKKVLESSLFTLLYTYLILLSLS